ncbi:MAG: amino acid-binding protein [Bacteroidaceae bacterium]|nr:amino acid-binding protein [Bacteroidaceae bacterium]
MTIHQLSVFLENRSGTLVRVLQQLKASGVQIIASSVADTADYGILRLICSEPLRACDELKKAGVPVTLTEVFALELDNQPGAAAEVVEKLSDKGISITYLYSFLLEGKGILILRTDNAEQTLKVISDYGLKYIAEGDLAERV